MDPYNQEIGHYEDAAEEHFDNYYPEEDGFDQGFEGNEDTFDGYDDGYEEIEYISDPVEEEGYDNYSATSIGTIDPNDRTYTIKITNSGTEPVEAVIFAANENPAPPAGLEISVLESSHNEVKEEVKSNPFQISGLKMVVTDTAQFNNIWQITRRTSTGTKTTRPYQPLNARSPQNQDANMIDDAQFAADITAQDSIRFLQNPGTTTLTLTVKARANMGNLLKGHNVAEMSHTPRTTGLVQFDQSQSPSKLPFGIQSGKKVRKIIRRKGGSESRSGMKRPASSRHGSRRGRSSRSRYLRRQR